MHSDAGDQSIPSDDGETAVAAASGLIWQLLAFTMQFQQQTNWCWAAVAASVDTFVDGAAAMSQCDVADGERQRNDCCGAGAAGPCNVYGSLFSSLNRVGHQGKWGYKKVATLAKIHEEIAGLRPVCFRTASTGGGAHFVAVIGYLRGSEAVAGSEIVGVEDSWWGPSDVPYDQFVTNYRTGICTDTFYTIR